MPSVEDEIYRVISSCQRALNTYYKQNKRLAVGDLDYAKDYLVAAISILINEIEDEEGQF